MPGFLSSRPNWGIGTPYPLTRKIPPVASKGGDTLAWGEGVGGPNSDYWTYTGTLGLLQYLRTRKSISVLRNKRICTRSSSREKHDLHGSTCFPGSYLLPTISIHLASTIFCHLHTVQGCMEYWMIYWGPGILAVVWFGSSKSQPPPPPSISCLSISVFLCVAGRAYWRKRGEEVEEEPNHVPARKPVYQSLILSAKMKSFWLQQMVIFIGYL